MPSQRMIGFLSPQLGGFFFGGVLSGVKRVIQQRGYHLVAVQTTLDILGLQIDSNGRYLARDQVAGWIGLQNDDILQGLAGLESPVVGICGQRSDCPYPHVLPDNRGGTRVVVEHLIDHGHQRIGFVGKLENSDVQERLVGYQEALAARGLVSDSQLIFNTVSTQEVGGRLLGQQLIGEKLPCTAFMASTDLNAIGLINVFLKAGYRLPQDVAIVGFDDIEIAQFANPPLTTVHQYFDVLGQTAARLLLSKLDGERVLAGPVYVPTELVIRHSCGCVIGNRKVFDFEQIPVHERRADWQEQLTQALVRQILAPLEPDPAVPLGQLWPGAKVLVAGLAAMVEGTELPSVDAFAQAWFQALKLNSSSEILLGLVELLRRAGAEELAQRSADTAAHERVDTFMNQMIIEIVRTSRNESQRRIHMLEEVNRMNLRMSIVLLQEQTWAQHRLAWMEKTPLKWGCLAEWHQTDGAEDVITVVDSYTAGEGGVDVMGRSFPAAAFPPAELLPNSSDPNDETLLMLLPILTAEKDWGVLAVHDRIEWQFASSLNNNSIWAALLGVAMARAELLAVLADEQAATEAQRQGLQEAYERERELAATVRQLGAPVIPLMRGVLLVPLVGNIDEARAEQILSAVLDGVVTHTAQVVLLDITGVPLVDTQIANSLIATARATVLLGARIILVGIRPEIAQSIVALGVDLRGFTTYSTLSEAIQQLMRLNL